MTVRNPRKEYIVHGTVDVTAGLDGTRNTEQKVTWTFASETELKKAANHGGTGNYGGWNWYGSDQTSEIQQYIAVINMMEAEAESPTGGLSGLGTAFRGFRLPKASVGISSTNNYKKTFFSANPKLVGEVVVHHAVEQQMLKLYPELFTKAELNSLENLRGIPNDLNNKLHLSDIRRDWNKFYNTNPNATREQVLNQATLIDKKYGNQFKPPVN